MSQADAHVLLHADYRGIAETRVSTYLVPVADAGQTRSGLNAMAIWATRDAAASVT